jgi:hypothetical protein
VGSDDKEMEMLDKAETFQDGQPVSSRSVMKEVHEARDTRFDIGDTDCLRREEEPYKRSTCLSNP